MMLIADGGSTKTSWCSVDDSGKSNHFSTEGYNPFLVSKDYIIESLNESIFNRVKPDEIKNLNFYGAGVHTPQQVNLLHSAFSSVFKNCEIHIAHDLIAAARALLGKKAGFAAILGTGTNTCLYNGDKITHQIESCGYLLGDEGSGFALGRVLLQSYLRKELPKPLASLFEESYEVDADSLIQKVYAQPLPNRYIADFSKFIKAHLHHAFMYDLVDQSFDLFFKNLVSKYPKFQDLEFNCVGSIAFQFQDVLTARAACYGMSQGIIINHPINNLVKYHQSNL